MTLRTALVLAGPDRIVRTAVYGEATVTEVLAKMDEKNKVANLDVLLKGEPEVVAVVSSDHRTVEIYEVFSPRMGGDGQTSSWPIAVILPPNGSAAGKRSQTG